MKNIFVITATTILLLGCSSSPKKEFIKEIVTFSNYDSISWDATIENYYDIFDWNNDVKEQFYAETSNIDLEFEKLNKVLSMLIFELVNNNILP
mgnify:CR=1 FL=1